MYRPTSDRPDVPGTSYTPRGSDPVSADSLRESITVDVAVIGGGFVGCSAALETAGRGAGVAILEAREVGWGSAGRNAGQVSAHASKLEPDGVLRTYGPVYGERLNEAGANAPAMVQELGRRYGMDLSVVAGGILTAAHWQGTADKLRKRADFWQRRGAQVEWLDRAAVAEVVGSDYYHSGVVDRRGIAINPLAFVRGLARAAMAAGVRIYHHSPVRRIERRGDRWVLHTPGGEVNAAQVLICTNAYTNDLWPGLRSTVIPVRGYQVWSKPLPERDRARVLRGVAAMMDTRRLLSGMRLHADGRLQFSGGVGFGAEHTPNFVRSLARVQAILPHIAPLEVEGWWSGWVTRGIGDGWRIHELAPGLLTAMGCNGRGVAMGPIVGREMAKYAGGTPASELILPISEPKPISGFAFYGWVAPLVQRYYGWRDGREVRLAHASAGRRAA